MSTAQEMMDRGVLLANKYTEEELKSALKEALFMEDNEERLSLQYALKTKTKTKDGYKFTKEQEGKISTKLSI